MFSEKEIKAQYGTLICRRCLNKFYGVKLLPKDCLYEYHYVCPGCGEEHHIVSGLKLSGKFKTLLK